MSGGSMNYFYLTLEEYSDALKDPELNDLVRDLAELFREREWFDSGDTSEGDWNKAVFDFKTKWFEESRDGRLKGYLSDMMDGLKKAWCTYPYCKDCSLWEAKEDSEAYGECPLHKNTLHHAYDYACKEFKHG